MFRSNWELIINNIYDVVCLSTKVFFLDDEKLMMELFPEDKVRVIYKR
ncbi:CDI toxin immunity protein [Pasteurella multocida]